MYCRNCGSQINDDAVICINCGVPTGKKAPQKEQNVLALVGFVLSFFVQIAGLVCSIIAYRRCKEDPTLEGKNMALAGIIISATIIAVTVLVAIFYFSIIWAILLSLIRRGGM